MRIQQQTFASLLRSLRSESKLGLRETARMAGVSAGFVKDVELGRRLPSPEVIDRLAVAVGDGAGKLRKAAKRQRVAALKDRIAEIEREAV